MELKTGDFFCEHAYRDEQDHLWLYLREEELTDRYPNGGYRILGDLTKKADAKDLVLVGAQGQRHPLSPYRGKLKKNEKVKGYIPLDEEDAYVRIVEKKKGRLLSYLIAAVLLITIFLGGIWLGQVNRAVDEPVRIASGELSNPNPENIRLPGITEVHARAGDTRVKQLLLNVEGNAYNLTYTITLDETGEELYESRPIPPGYGVQEFDMERTLDTGTYPITIHVASSALQEDDGESNAAYNAGELTAVLIVE